MANPTRSTVPGIIEPTAEESLSPHALMQSDHLLSLLGRYAPAAIALLDRQLRYILCTNRWLQEFNITEEVIGRSHYEIFPDLSGEWKEIYRSCLAGASHQRGRDPFQHKDGSIEWLRWEIHPWRDDCGEIGGIILFAEAMTERVIGESILHQREEQLRMEMERYRDSQRQLMQAERLALLGYWEMEIKSNHFAISEGLYRLHGLPLDYPLSTPKDLFNFTHSEEYAKFQTSVKNAIATKSNFEFEYEIQRPDGEIRTLYGRGEPIFNDEGEVIKLQAIAQDITERKRAQAALEKSAQQLASTERLARLGYWEWNLQKDSLDVSEGIYAILGLPRDYPLHKIEDLAPFLKRNECGVEVALDPQMKFNQESYDIRYKIVRYDGEIRQGRGRSTITRAADGKVIQISGSVQDVTEQVLAEEALQEQEQKLAEAQRIAHLGSWTWDRINGKITWSAQTYELLGYDPANTIPSVDALLKVTHPDDVPLVLKMVRSIIDEKQPIQFRHRLLRHDGTLRYVQSRQDVQLDDEGTLIGIDGTIQDITSLVEKEQALAAQAIELERSNRDLAQFAYVASHDLQEPLRKIKSFTELLAYAYKDQLDDNANLWINYIVDGAARMQTLIKDVLAYSRLGNRKDLYETIDLNSLLAQVEITLQPLIEQTKARILADPLPTIHANLTQMSQLLQNLIENAIKFRSQDAPQIEIRVEAAANLWRFSVGDNGIGIAPEYSTRIFDMFSRLHQREEYSGNGVGLAICKKIVESHQGEIGVESTPGQGSTFWFTLPRARGYSTFINND